MTLVEFLAALRRHRFVFAVLVIVGLAGGVYHAKSTPRTYRATTTTVINIPAGRGSLQDTLAGAQLSRQLMGTYAQVATSGAVAQRVVSSLGLTDSAESLRHKLSAVAEDNSYLIHVSATDRDPVRAASIADATALGLSAEISDLESGKTDPVTARLLDRAVVPKGPISPRPKFDAAAGLLLGLLAGAAVVALLEALDRSVKGPAELSTLVEAPVLGIVPRLRAAARAPAATVDNPLTPDAEAYRALRTAIRFVDVDNPLQTVLITSAGPGEGKTTTATHFAVALAQGGERVVLIDGDLRRGTVLEVLGLPEGAGVTTVVTGAASLDLVLQPWRDLLHVLGTGPLPPNPSEILGSQAMASLLDELRAFAEFIVIDAPPVLPVTDAVALSTQVDGVVIVARDGRTDRNNLVETRRRLDGVGAHVVGCVLNEVKARGELYADYRYLSPQVYAPSLRERVSARLRR